MAEWITKKPAKMVDKKTTAKWITKKPKKMEDKETTAKWITKKPTKWITKKKPKSWIKRKPTDVRKGLIDRFSGGVEGKPHSSEEGRRASAGRKFSKIVERSQKSKGGRAGFQGGGRTRLLEELGRVEAEPSNRNRRAEISRVHGELNKGYKSGGRAKHGIGSLVKKIVTKIKPKPKEVNVDKLLKNLGDEIKAAPLPPQLKKSLEKLKKAYPSRSPHARNKESKKLFKTVQGKATGGRIGLSHGGSVGAAVKGHGAEIK